MNTLHSSLDVVVVGAGLAGLTAAWQIAGKGKSVRLVSKGWGATYWHAGCIDVFGYSEDKPETACVFPRAAVAGRIEAAPGHPYGLGGLASLEEALNALHSLCEAADYPMRGSLEENWLLPTAVGAARPTCLAPETMIAGDLQNAEPMLVVGFRGLSDFYPALIADNLVDQGITAEGVMVDPTSLQGSRAVNSVTLARRFERAGFVDEVVGELRPQLGDASRVGFPAVLGLERPLAVKAELEEKLGLPVFEIPTLPPSVPGMRLHRILTDAIISLGGQVLDGMEVVAADVGRDQVQSVCTEAAARKRRHRAGAFVLATGGLLGGGFTADHEGDVREMILGLPLDAPADRLSWFKREFLDREGHPLNRVGVKVDGQLRPINSEGKPLYRNLFAAGTMLAECDALRERSFDGVALVTGYLAGLQVASYETS